MKSEKKILIEFNGEQIMFDAGLSLGSLLEAQQLKGRFVVVKNDEIVPRSAYAGTVLADGDTLEILSPISGG